MTPHDASTSMRPGHAVTRPSCRPAAAEDLDLLVTMMAEFYAESGYAADPVQSRAAFTTLLRDERLGRVWIGQLNGSDAGYLALTLTFSMEYGGATAFIDDLYIRQPYRGRGLGRALLDRARDEARRLGVHALHLEVDPANTPAIALYRSSGFAATRRQLLTLRLPAGTGRAARNA